MKHHLLPLFLLPAACASTTAGEPSLAPRAAEAIDPRLPVDGGASVIGTADPALAAEVAALVAGAIAASAAFDAAAPATEQLVAAAGPAQSDSWIEAQQAVSALESMRSTLTAALSRLDDLAATRIERTGGIATADQALISKAHGDLDPINDRQAGLVSSLSARLGG